MPAIAKIEVEYPELAETLNKHSVFNWYFSKQKIASGHKDVLNNLNQKLKLDRGELQNIEWIPVKRDESRPKLCVLDEQCVERLIKVEVIPSDGNRQGLAIDTISTNIVVEKFNLDDFPMTDRHKLTSQFVDSDS